MVDQSSQQSELERNLIDLNRRIETACEASHRDRSEITLVGATKTRDAAQIARALHLGISHFGENYVDEALSKIHDPLLSKESQEHPNNEDLTWHYIGRIQRNKTKTIAAHFDWVHTVDRLSVAKRLSDQRVTPTPLNVCLQVNVDEDPAKAGAKPSELAELVETCAQLPNLRLRGLMTILAQGGNARASYQSVAQLADELCSILSTQQQTHWDCLSMGMSGDLEAAIAAGATHIRIGTALFGARTD